MHVTVNGELMTLAEQTTIDQLLNMLQLVERRVAVEVNEEIVPRSSFAQHCLGDSDTIEIINAIGGG